MKRTETRPVSNTRSPLEKRLARLLSTSTPPLGTQPEPARPKVDLVYLDQQAHDRLQVSLRE